MLSGRKPRYRRDRIRRGGHQQAGIRPGPLGAAGKADGLDGGIGPCPCDNRDAVIHYFDNLADHVAMLLFGKSGRFPGGPDLVILAEQPRKYLEDIIWAEQFGEIEKYQVEEYGKLTSLRVWYHSGHEVEYGLTTLDWAAQPLDVGTERVIYNGMLVLFERKPLLSPHLANRASST